MEMKLLSEFKGNGVTANVYYRKEKNDYVTICYDENGFERSGNPFNTEQQAEDFAEDWVL